MFGSDEATLIVKRWDDLGPDINKTGLVKLTLKQIEGMIHPEDLQSCKRCFDRASWKAKLWMALKLISGSGVNRATGDGCELGPKVIQRDHEGRPAEAVGCFADLNEVCSILETVAVGEGSEAVAETLIRFDVGASRIR